MRRFFVRAGQQRRIQIYSGGAPSIFVSGGRWPAVSASPVLTGDPDDPEVWVSLGLSIGDILDIRARTIIGRTGNRRISEAMEEIALSSTPVEVEAHFAGPVRVAVKYDGTIAPVGLSGQIERLDVTGCARVERPVDRVTSDPDLNATEAMNILYRSGLSHHRITQLLSAGLLGRRRRPVPTRWAITAADETLFSAIRGQITRLPPAQEMRIYHAELHANRFVCLVIPGMWEFEMIEMWEPRSPSAGGTWSISRDGEWRETHHPSSPLAGAYYAARLAVAEHLARRGECAGALVVRRISSGYLAPLGVWVIREGVRAALTSPPVTVESPADAARKIDEITGTGRWREYSHTLTRFITQTTLSNFL
ncbi:MAG: hypothetical protein ACXQTG_03695 [Methanoculleaceae archaeon]